MGIELAANDSESFDFTERSCLIINHSKTEEAQLVRNEPKTIRERARLADLIWIVHMKQLAAMTGDVMGIMALSDGVTSHMVNSCGVFKGPDDFIVAYHDPWPPERGSFLEQGKNIAGCEAKLREDGSGLWVIAAEELFRVLDSVVTLNPEKQAKPKTSDGTAGAS